MAPSNLESSRLTLNRAGGFLREEVSKASSNLTSMKKWRKKRNEVMIMLVIVMVMMVILKMQLRMMLMKHTCLLQSNQQQLKLSFWIQKPECFQHKHR
jgi:hypothetical protein